MGFMKRLVCCTALGAVFAGAPEAAVAAAAPAAAFFQDAETANARMAPDGRHVAMASGEAGVRMGLVVVDLATMKPRVLARFPNADVGAIYWLNDKRMIFSVINIPPGATDSMAGMYAIDVDGSNLTGLEKLNAGARRFNQMDCFACGERPTGLLVHHMPENSDKLFINVVFQGNHGIGKLDSRTRIIDEVQLPGWSFAWVVDDEERVRVALSHQDGQQVLHYRGHEGDWRTVASVASASSLAFRPVYFGNNTLYVATRNGGNDGAIYRYDLDKASVADEPLISAPGFDVGVDWLSDGRKIYGVRVTSDSERTIWFDAQMKATQAAVDALLPDTVNRIQRPHRGQTPYLLVDAYSPARPNRWLVFNRDTLRFTQLGAAFPAVDPARTGVMEFVRYPARDGMQIPAYVTVPRSGSGKQLPTVVLLGGAAGQRNGDWTWQPDVQFLASRGYAVIQPQPRGTQGFGLAHLRLGDKDRASGAQNDVADSAAWAIAQGIADPKRICVIGTLHGGYLALTALTRDGALFRCGAGIAAVGALPGVIGKPLLLAYGKQDDISAAQGQRLATALRKAGNDQLEFHEYEVRPEDASLAANRIDLWTRIDRFLGQHIGPAAGPASAPTATP